MCPPRAASSSVGLSDHVLLHTYVDENNKFDDNSTNVIRGEISTTVLVGEATKTIKVTMAIADLPSLSYFHVGCPEPKGRSAFGKRPEIFWSFEDLVLFRFRLDPSCPSEYFIYRAGQRGRKPSLDLLRGVGLYFVSEGIDPSLVGVIPADGNHYVLAAFRSKSGCLKLHIYHSESCDWTIVDLDPDFPSWVNMKLSRFFPDKVIALSRGLGYVDLWKGIVYCNVLDKKVTAKFFPLPNPLPNNQKYYHGGNRFLGGSAARVIRDVASAGDSTIRCVEMEDLFGFTTIPDANELVDSEIDPTKAAVKWKFLGWRLVIWVRDISLDHWCKEGMLHVDELGSVSLPHCATTKEFPFRKPSSGSQNLPLKRLISSCPVLCGDGIVCLLSKMENETRDAWIVTIDMRKKVVSELVPYYDEGVMLFNPNYISCALKKYLKGESGARKGCEGGPKERRAEVFSLHGKEVLLEALNSQSMYLLALPVTSIIRENPTMTLGGVRFYVEDARFHGKRRQLHGQNTSESSQPKKILRGSTMEQRKCRG